MPKREKAQAVASGATVKAAAGLFCILLAMWLLASGHYTMMMIGFGVASSAAVVALGLVMRVVDDEAVPVRLLGRAIGYVPWIAWEVLKANVDVARRILGPSSAISPRIIEAPTSQKSELGRILYANSITLTPGTVSIRVHGKAITVHAIADEVADGLLEGVMDRKVTWFEGLA
jgi:multicomponent Na+:H+ antiporter subunit E